MSKTRRTAVTAVGLAAMLMLAAPGAINADSAYGCTFPGELPKKELLSEPWDAKGLVMFIKNEGSLEVRSRYPDPLLIQPVATLWAAGGRETLTEIEGRPVQLAPGRYPMSEAIINGIFDKLARQIIVGIGPKVEVLSSETLDHDARLPFPRVEGVVALTLEFVNAKPREGDGINSHKLVLFLRAIGETEKNLRR